MDIFSSDSILLQKTLYKDFKYILKIYTKDFGLITADVMLNHQIQHAHIQPLLLAKVQF